MDATVLLAEDDAAIRAVLTHHLERDGFRVIAASDGHEALQLARTGADIGLFDIGLPGIDGLELVRALRREGIDMPVIYVTARVDEIDRIIGLEVGADDYITKPFSPRETVARIRAVLRRTSRAIAPMLTAAASAGTNSGSQTALHDSKRALRFGRLEIDEIAREARVDGSDIALKPREFSLLLMFARNHNIALSRDTLIENVWGFDFDGDARTVDVHVRRLRAKLCGECGMRSPIQTLQGYGYKFTPEK